MTDQATQSAYGVSLPRASVIDRKLVFENLGDADRALAFGLFLVAIPEGIDVSPGLELCRNFYKPARHPGDRYRGHREERHPQSQLGYSDRPNQVEQLQVESIYWDTYLPPEVASLLRKMEVLTLDTLHGVFELAGVPQQDWETITGAVGDGGAWVHTTVNHFRSDVVDRIGIVEHTDAGFITMLLNDQPGYEMLYERQWVPIGVEKDCFLANMGDSIDILTRKLPRPVTSVIHRVPEVHPDEQLGDRSSFTCYIGPRYDMCLYQYTENGTLGEYMGFREFSVGKARRLGYEFHPRI